MSLKKKLLLIVIGTAIVVPFIFLLSQIAVFYKTDIFVNLSDVAQQEKKWSETESEIRKLLATQEIVEVGFRHESHVLKVQFRKQLTGVRLDHFLIELAKDPAFSINGDTLTANESRERIGHIVETVRLVGNEEWFAIFWVKPTLTQFEVFDTLNEFLPDDPNVIFILP